MNSVASIEQYMVTAYRTHLRSPVALARLVGQMARIILRAGAGERTWRNFTGGRNREK